MATSKRLGTQELKTAFASAADYEIKRREGRTAEDLARARKQAQKERAEKKAADAKAREDARYEKKIIAIFKEAKKIYDKAFGETGNMIATIKDNKIKIEEVWRPQYHARPHPNDLPPTDNFEPTFIHGLYGKIITVKNGALSYRSWGRRIDPQYRNCALSLDEKNLRTSLLSPATTFGDTESLKKMSALMASGQKKKPQNTPRPRT